MAIRVDFTEKELIEIFRNTINDEEHLKYLIKQINIGNIIPIRGYGYNDECRKNV